MGFGFGEGFLGGAIGALACLVGWCLLAYLFVLKRHSGFVLSKNWSFFFCFLTFPEALRTQQQSASCQLLKPQWKYFKRAKGIVENQDLSCVPGQL